MSSLGKQKGAQFERSVCVRLSLWVSGHTREDVFWRSAMSGGRATVQARRKGKKLFDTQSGDISAIHPSGHLLLQYFSIECKFYKTLEVDVLLFGGRGHLLTFWQQALREALRVKKLPLLVAKENRRQELLCTTKTGYRMLRKGGPVKLLAKIPGQGMYVLTFREVVTRCNFAKLREVYGG